MKERATKEKAQRTCGLTLAQYAKAKMLKIAFLVNHGLSDATFAGKPAVRIPYHNPRGRECAVRFRLGMKGDRFRWEKGAKPCLYGLERLAQLRSRDHVVVPEGESDSHTLWSQGFPALGLPGANSWREEWAQHFAGFKKIYVVVEPDLGGETILKRLSKSSVRERVWLVRLDGPKDPSELYLENPEKFRKNFKKQLKFATPLRNAPEPNQDDQAEESAARRSQANLLIAIAKSADLFKYQDKPYAAVPVNGHRENWPVNSTRFKQWLGRTFYASEKVVPRAQVVQDALNVIGGVALYEGEERPVFTRIGEHGGKIYLDLADSNWRAVEITPNGWNIVNDPPIRFRRAGAMAALPEPVCGGSIDELWPFVNAASQRDRILIVAWLVAALRPRGPYPILALHGEQGSGKSTAERVMRSLVDPSTANMRCSPREVRDLMITATNSHVVALDNLSHIPGWLSDALCRLSTGGGFSTRELYTDSEEIVFDAMRPILLNGIGEVTTRPDLMERTIIIGLPPIAGDQRQDEAEFWLRFESARPRILGVLLDGVAGALREFESVHLKKLPRMADFAKWSTAAEDALGFKPYEFEYAYDINTIQANSLVVENSLVATRLREFLDSPVGNGDPILRGPWVGTASELLNELYTHGSFSTRESDSWPKSPAGLATALRRLGPNLRTIGIEVRFCRVAGTGKRLIKVVKKAGINASQPSHLSQAPEETDVEEDFE